MEAGLRTKRFLVSCSVWFWRFLSDLHKPLLPISHLTSSCSTSPPTAYGRIWRFCRTICWKDAAPARADINWRPTYVRAQFEQMGLKSAGVNGSYFQNVRFRKIELQRDKSSFVGETITAQAGR